MNHPTAAPERAHTARSWRLWAALAALVIVSLGPLVKPLTVQPGSRLALTAALVDGHTVRIDDYGGITRPGDRVDAADGHLYSDKAPGQPIWAIPAYAMARLVGAEPASVVSVDGNLTLWAVTFWSCVVAAAALVVLMQIAASRYDRRGSIPVALALLFGSPMMVWAVELYGHMLAAAFAFAAWLILSRCSDRPGWVLSAGFLIGLAVVTENPVALIGVVLIGYLLWARRFTALVWLAVGAFPAAVVLALYNTAAFGGPFVSAYSLHVGTGGTAVTDLATGPPRLDVIADLLFGGRGFILTPLVLLGVGAAVALALRRMPGRVDAVVALAVLVAMVLFEATRRTGWPGPLGGEMPAPRHLIPTLPFLAAPLAALWPRLRVAILITAAIGFCFMVLPTLTLHLIPFDVPYLDWYRSAIDEHGVAPTIFTKAIGGAGWFVQLALIVGAAWWTRFEWRRASRRTPSRQGVANTST